MCPDLARCVLVAKSPPTKSHWFKAISFSVQSYHFSISSTSPTFFNFPTFPEEYRLACPQRPFDGCLVSGWGRGWCHLCCCGLLKGSAHRTLGAFPSEGRVSFISNHGAYFCHLPPILVHPPFALPFPPHPMSTFCCCLVLLYSFLLCALAHTITSHGVSFCGSA